MALSDVEQRLCEAAARREAAMRADLARHVAIPTGHNHRPGLDEYRHIVVERLVKLNADARTAPGDPRPSWVELRGAAGDQAPYPPTVLIRHRAAATTPRVLIAGHLDTVHDPHGPFRELTINSDGLVAAGPGVVDMKGGILIAINALEALAECGVELNWTFLLNSDEETGSFHSMETLRRAASEHDVGIVVEPALPDGGLVIERMGSGQFKVEAFGRAAHLGRDFARGVSAVAKLAEIITELAAMSDAHSGLIVNVGPLVGGAVTNAVPDYAACWGNVRFVDAEGARTLAEKLDALATPMDAMPRVVVHRIFNRPAKPCTDAVRKLAEAARETASDVGQTLPFGKTGGVCDGNILQDAGLPTLDTLGVRGGNLHRTDEFIELPSLVERCQLLAVLLARIARGTVKV